MRKVSGFSLIELLIVVAIILIIASIAIPNLLRARMQANEASAVSSIRTLFTAQISYQSAYPTTGFAANLAQLGPPNATTCPTPNSTNGCFIDFTLSTATAAPGKNGYIFNVTNSLSGTAFQAAAAAVNWNQTGVRSFCAIADGTPRFKIETATVPPTSYTGADANCTALAPLQ
jgi:prepilin-type N-terminal cleavage/methylation domain-containing protein